jgi:hypothetical protein
MSDIRLHNASEFGERFMRAYLEQGFQVLSKKDVEMLIFALLEIDGAIDRQQDNYNAARILGITPQKINSLRRDSYARWRHLINEDRAACLKRIYSKMLTSENIKSGAIHAAEKNKKDGFIAVRIDHADDRAELEQSIIEVGGIPVFERNRDVLCIHFSTLISIGERYGFLENDSRKIRNQLKSLAPAAEEVMQLLKKDIKDITWVDLRTVLNSVGAKSVSGMVDTKVSDLLKLAFPFLK